MLGIKRWQYRSMVETRSNLMSAVRHNIFTSVSENKEVVKGLNLLSTCLIHVKSVILIYFLSINCIDADQPVVGFSLAVSNCDNGSNSAKRFAVPIGGMSSNILSTRIRQFGTGIKRCASSGSWKTPSNRKEVFWNSAPSTFQPVNQKGYVNTFSLNDVSLGPQLKCRPLYCWRFKSGCRPTPPFCIAELYAIWSA